MFNWQAQTVRYALHPTVVADVSFLLMDKSYFPDAPVHAMHKALILAERGLGNAEYDLKVLSPSSTPHYLVCFFFLALSLPCLMLSGFPVCTFTPPPGYIVLTQFLFYF